MNRHTITDKRIANDAIRPDSNIAAEANLALGRRTVARKYLAELDSALVKADPDFPPLLRAAELHQQLDQPTSTS